MSAGKQQTTTQKSKASPKRPSAKASKSNKPTRPLSAYNLFYKFDRERLLAGVETQVTPDDVLRLSHEHRTRPKRAHRKSHGKYSFLELSRVIAGRWKELPAESKKIFQDQAAIEKLEYDEKVKAWNQAQMASGGAVNEEGDSDSRSGSPMSVNSAQDECDSRSFGSDNPFDPIPLLQSAPQQIQTAQVAATAPSTSGSYDLPSLFELRSHLDSAIDALSQPPVLPHAGNLPQVPSQHVLTSSTTTSGLNPSSDLYEPLDLMDEGLQSWDESLLANLFDNQPRAPFYSGSRMSF